MDLSIDVGCYNPRDNSWHSERTVVLSGFQGASAQMVIFELRKQFDRPGMRQEELECVDEGGNKVAFEAMRSLEENGVTAGSGHVLRIWNGKPFSAMSEMVRIFFPVWTNRVA
jgi:hypothetical protein